MIDTTQYLGLPYDINNETGYNCWGLYCLVKKQEQGQDVAMFRAINSTARGISDTFNAEIKLGNHGHTQVQEPQQFDLVLLKRVRLNQTIYHCGVYVDGMILHANGNANSGQVWHEPIANFDRWAMEFWRYE